MLKNWRISTKIITAVLFVSFLGASLTAYAAYQLAQIENGYHDLVANRDPAVVDLARVGRNMAVVSYAAYRVAYYDDPGAMEDAASDRTEAFEASYPLLSEIRQAFPEKLSEIAAFEAGVRELDEKSAEAVRLGTANLNEEALQLLVEIDGLQNRITEQYRVLRDAMLADVADRSAAMGAQVDRSITMVAIGALTGLILGIVGALLISSKGITGPLGRLNGRMTELASGEIDADVDGIDRKDEIGGMSRAVQVFRDNAVQARLLEREAVAMREGQEAERERVAAIDKRTQDDLQHFVDSIEGGFGRLSQGDMTVRIDRPVAAQYEPIRGQFNETVAKLESTFGSVVTSIGSIRTGLGEINVASNDLAQRTEQQAASLEQTVAALAEVTRAVNETAQDAGRAQESAESANRNAAKGGEIVGKAVEAMRAIEQSSEKIGKIIGVIDEIAFQTNLLALNAGVEAARAGEAGRGFAVVAQEVRGLAQRSAEAAKEIKDLISASSVQVEAGVELVSASGRSLDDIIREVSEMSRNVAEIAKRAREQAVSLKEVQTAADQMDKVTQQNAAMVEEATAAAQSLAAETDELGRLIAEFKLASSAGRTALASRAAPARPSAPAPSRPAIQMRPVSHGNAALKTLEDNWEEF